MKRKLISQMHPILYHLAVWCRRIQRYFLWSFGNDNYVFEKNHKFLKINEDYYRSNEIWRNKIAKFKGGAVLETELITKNFAKVKYTPEQYEESNLHD